MRKSLRPSQVTPRFSWIAWILILLPGFTAPAQAMKAMAFTSVAKPCTAKNHGASYPINFSDLSGMIAMKDICAPSNVKSLLDTLYGTSAGKSIIDDIKLSSLTITYSANSEAGYRAGNLVLGNGDKNSDAYFIVNGAAQAMSLGNSVGGTDYLLVVLAHELGHAAYGDGDNTSFYDNDRKSLPRLRNIVMSENRLRRELGLYLRASKGLEFKPTSSQVRDIQGFC